MKEKKRMGNSFIELAWRAKIGGATSGASALLGLIALLVAPAASAATPPQVLRVFSIDVEGGAATLYVTPEGHSLLIDTGWPAGMGGTRHSPDDPAPPSAPSSAQRIAAVARRAGVDRIDYLLLTHYHVDHSGGIAELASLLSIGTFIDHGPVRERPRAGASSTQLATAAATLYDRYIQTVGTHPHWVMKPGETIKIDDFMVTAVDSDRAVIGTSLVGREEAGTHCAQAITAGDLGGEENPRSLGIVATWGRARIMSLGDTTWDVENTLVCPRNLIGPIDLMFVDNHGSANSNSPPLLDTARPTVVIVNNGPTKGADGVTLDRLAASPSIRGVWQLHSAERSPQKNNPETQIANLSGPDMTNPLDIDVHKDGTIVLINPRNHYRKSYRQGRP